jgi:hypothetical protein
MNNTRTQLFIRACKEEEENEDGKCKERERYKR